MKVINSIAVRSAAALVFVLCANTFPSITHAADCPVENHLVAHYPLDNAGSSALTDSVGGAPGSSQKVDVVNGVLDSALRFDHASSASTGQARFPVSTGLTISMWVKPSSLESVESRFISKATGIQGYEHYLMVGAYAGDALRFRLKTRGTSGTTTTLISRGGQLRVGEWSFVTFTYNGSEMRIYHNARLIARTAKGGGISQNDAVRMAIGNQPAGAGSRPYLGDMDDIRVYDVALSDSEVTRLMQYRAGDCSTAVDQEPPAVPNALRADEISSNSVRLSWAAVEDNAGGAGLAGYRIFRDHAGTRTTVAVTADTFIRDSELEPDTSYTYRVLAFDKADPSNESAAASITVKSDKLTGNPANDSAGNFQLVSLEVRDISDSSAVIHWTTSEAGSGEVNYGKSSAYSDVSSDSSGQATTSHSHRLHNLTPGAVYHYSVRSINLAGEVINSEDATFQTLSAVTAGAGGGSGVNTGTSGKPAVEGWPSHADETLPMAGIFYGQPEGGLVTGNAPIALESSRRFRAEKSGYIDAVRYNNRTLLDQNIANRCKPSAPDSLWCKCVKAGLDRYTCGYTLGNSYSVGNGGSIIIEIRPDDGTDKHEPSNTVLGRTAGLFVPLNRAGEHYPVLELESPVRLQAGQIYHLVYRNVNPPSTCRYSGLSVQQAANCPRNQGAIGLNGTTQALQFGVSRRHGPSGGDAAGNLIRYSRTGSWTDVKTKLSWYEVRYNDGTWIGDSHTGYGSTGNGRKFLTESTLVRQVFTVRDSSRTVDGLWVYYGHTYTSTPDGTPMSVTLKDSTGTVLATGSIKSSPECARAAAEGLQERVFTKQHCRVWEYTDLSRTVSLLEGARYTLEFSASRNAGFSLHTFFPLNYGVYRSTSRNHWRDAHAEVSTNGGSSWSKWAGAYYPDRDINMLFTIEGMPKQLP